MKQITIEGNRKIQEMSSSSVYLISSFSNVFCAAKIKAVIIYIDLIVCKAWNSNEFLKKICSNSLKHL